MDKPGPLSATGPPPSTTSVSVSVEDIRQIAQEVAIIILDTPTTSNLITSSLTHTSIGDAVTGNFW